MTEKDFKQIFPLGEKNDAYVWEVDPAGKSDEQIAIEGLSCMEVWMKELGLTMNLHELGVSEEMLKGIASGTLIMKGGYKVLNHDEVLEILKNSL